MHCESRFGCPLVWPVVGDELLVRVDELLVLSGSYESDGRISDSSRRVGRLCGGGCYKLTCRYLCGDVL
jgi:hypothetical protein